ncbi:MAG TPA: HopJ type III effector protein [Cellvibrionaceae bacterium]
MTLDIFLIRLNSEPLNIEFEETINIIDACYHYTPTAFTNGDLYNQAGSNEGSCKILAFAQLNGLTEAQTLACFGAYYRDDVLANPDGSDHANIRNFIRHGWPGVSFENTPLVLK